MSLTIEEVLTSFSQVLSEASMGYTLARLTELADNVTAFEVVVTTRLVNQAELTAPERSFLADYDVLFTNAYLRPDAGVPWNIAFADADLFAARQVAAKDKLTALLALPDVTLAE